jgi:hypothetical protein
MPRLRRQARQRRERPQLNTAVWEWLKAGRPATETLADTTRWDIFFLDADEPHKETFWKLIYRAVLDGEIELSETKMHCQGDARLLPSRNECGVGRP